MTLVSEGLSEVAARSRIWLVDSRGLVHASRVGPDAFKHAYTQSHAALRTRQTANVDRISLEDVVQHVRRTMLIGTAAQPGSFTEVVVRKMARHVDRPIIFPLYNPTSQCEANPPDLLAWTEGGALIATGSPFVHIAYDGMQRHIGQCNNAFIFPVLGLVCSLLGHGESQPRCLWQLHRRCATCRRSAPTGMRRCIRAWKRFVMYHGMSRWLSRWRRSAWDWLSQQRSKYYSSGSRI